MKNKIIIICLILLSLNIVSAQINVINLPYTDSENTFEYENVSQTEFINYDNSNSISYLHLNVLADLSNYTSNNRGVVISFEDNFTYVFLEKNYPYLVYGYDTGLKMHSMRHYLLYKNYTINETLQNFTELNLIPTPVFLDIEFDIKTHNTSFQMTTGYLKKNKFERNIGTSSDTIIQSLLPLNLNGKYIEFASKIELEENINSLSNVGKLLYKSLTLFGVFGDSDFIYKVVSIIDLFISTILLIFNLFFTYPYLILIYIISFGNIFVSYKSNTLREIIFNYKDYILWIIGIGQDSIKYVISNYVIIIIIFVVVAILTYINNSTVLSWLL